MIQSRITVVFVLVALGLLLVIVRLFYWQVIASQELSALGMNQHRQTYELYAGRGKIRTSDGFPLATNLTSYIVYAYTPNFSKPVEEVVHDLAPILSPALLATQEATESASQQMTSVEEAQRQLLGKLSRNDVVWVPLVRSATLEQKKAIEELKIDGIGTEPSSIREYPEATMAARMLGFVGSDSAGNPKGYFGLEGMYDLELKGRPGIVRHEKDAMGKPILIGKYEEIDAKDGRDIVLHLDRAVQRIVEKNLERGLRRYGAASGDVTVVEPKTGAVLAMASLPAYDPARHTDFSQETYKNPVIAETYEPGSTFKVLVMSAALDSGKVSPETRCTGCDGAVIIGSYTIRTWNNEYHPDATMREVIQYSDNVGMVFVAQKLGVDTLHEYLRRFGIAERTGIDLEEETSSQLRDVEQWKPIDLATASFGQGIAITPIQMVSAVAAIANQGIIMKPQVVASVTGESAVSLTPQVKRRVVSQETAAVMTEMMVNAVENGEAKWIKPKGIKVAGKTGTAQIPVAGHYDEEKTIASFVGFAPADDPRFVMLVRLREPQTSPWGSETAAPLWFAIAEDLADYYAIPRK